MQSANPIATDGEHGADPIDDSEAPRTFTVAEVRLYSRNRKTA